MKSNILVKFLAVAILVILIVVIAKGRKEKTQPIVTSSQSEELGDLSDLSSVESGPTQVDNGLDINPFEDDVLQDEYGVDVDSPVETMRTLTNETRAVREDSVSLQEENKKLQQRVNQLLRMEESINNRVNSRFSNAEKDSETKQRELQHTQDLTRGLVSKLENRLEELQNSGKDNYSKTTANGYDIGNADIPTGLGYDENGVQVNYDKIVWINPIDAKVNPKDPTEITLPDFHVSLSADDLPDLAKGPTKNKKQNKEDRSIKGYTIPVNATLLGSVSMTAMLGRIPVNGQVIDPYPFKIIIGEENLSSNGISIPGVNGIKMTGIAKGDWTLGCVSGEISSMTFTFQDGTILTFPEPGTKASEPVAWFSDKNGIPCITGKRITNAVSYLSSRVGLSAASSYAKAEAASQFKTQSNQGGGLTSGLTGDPKVVAQNTAISDGLNEVTDWLDQRQENSFDAVYVPPGTELAIHVLEELKIDYDPEGRKVNHYAKYNRRSDSHLD